MIRDGGSSAEWIQQRRLSSGQSHHRLHLFHRAQRTARIPVVVMQILIAESLCKPQHWALLHVIGGEMVVSLVKRGCTPDRVKRNFAIHRRPTCGRAEVLETRIRKEEGNETPRCS